MTWFESIIIVAALTGSLGFLSGGFVMAGCVRWHKVAHFEGKADFAIMRSWKSHAFAMIVSCYGMMFAAWPTTTPVNGLALKLYRADPAPKSIVSMKFLCWTHTGTPGG
jgi:hypothetical protein